MTIPAPAWPEPSKRRLDVSCACVPRFVRATGDTACCGHCGAPVAVVDVLAEREAEKAAKVKPAPKAKVQRVEDVELIRRILQGVDAVE